MADEQHDGEAKRPTPEMHLQFVCAAYSIKISTWASAEAVDFAIAALRTFKRSYFGGDDGGDACMCGEDSDAKSNPT